MTHRDGFLSLGAFLYPAGHHIAAWRHPDAKADAGIDFKHYVALAQAAEAAKFDLIFLADGVGTRGDQVDFLSRTAHSYQAQFEPITLLSAIAAVTERIGLVATASTSFNEPYHVARKFASLDHISGGRAGWNLVTSSSEHEARNFNRDSHFAHADRYERAAEFADVVTGLWDSWEDDAFLRDKASGRFYDPAKRHVLQHRGKHFTVQGPLNVSRSPQGHPVVVQAGSSEAGKELAARTGEAVFTAQQTLAEAVAFYADVKGRLARYGRTPDDLKILPGVFPVVGHSESEAKEKFEQLQGLIDPVVGLALVSGLTGGIDLSGHPLDGPIPELPETNASKSRQHLVLELARRENLTIRQLYQRIAGARGHWQLVGTASQIADQLEERFIHYGADGYNIMSPVLPGGLTDFIALVLPELRRRGLFRTEYQGHTLREHLGLKRPAHVAHADRVARAATAATTALPDPDHLARETLRLLGPAPDNWVPARPGIDHNVAIIGGGQNGAALAFALQRAGIGQVSVIDATPDASQTGVWRTRARMLKLRTPKNLVGPELGLPGLSFQAWYEGRHGAEAYAAIDRIPRTAWADYLDWFREFVGVTVRRGTRLLRIEPVTEAGPQGAGPRTHFKLHLTVDGQARTETARKIILANGVAGNGEPFVPPALTGALAAGLAAHTAHAIDFDALRGKTVAVLGAAASAFDAAAVALEAGAAAVHLFARRDHITASPVARTKAYPGVYDNYHALPDATRWHQAVRYRRAGSTPPADSVQRVLQFPNFHLHLNAPWTAAQVEAGRIYTQLNGEDFYFDFAIAGTGYGVEPSARPELADIAPHILRWRDQFQPPTNERDDELAASPYLGSALEYLEKTPGTAPWLRDIHVDNPAGFASAGVPLGDVPSMRRDLPAIVARISRDLALADLALHEQRMRSAVPPDFDEDLYGVALWNGNNAKDGERAGE